MAKIHLVTGGSSGIGACLVERLRARGDQVIAPTRAALDLTQPSTFPAWARGIGAIDSVTHCAGVVQLDPVADFDLDAWNTTLAVNLIAPVALTSALLPALRSAGGVVVFINSGAGLYAHPNWSSYAASKFGLRAFADSLRGEEPGIRVTSVFPGRVATRMQAEVHRQEGKPYDANVWVRPETVVDQIVNVLDLPGDAQVPELTIRPR